MNNLQIFKNMDFNVRVTTIGEKPYFCLNDVCRILGVNNSRQVASRLDSSGVITNDATDSLGRVRSFSYINESNLYKVIFQSRKPEAEEFTEWVTSEVLPSIRKTGEYTTESFLQKTITDPGYVLGLIQKLKDDKPKVEMAEKLMLADGCVNVGQFAQMLGTGRNRLYNVLKAKRILKPNREPYQCYIEGKYIELKEVTKNGRIYTVPLITVKGQEYLLKKLGETND